MKMRRSVLSIMLLLLWTTAVFASEPNAKNSSDQPNTAPVDAKKPGAMIPEKDFTFDPVVDGSAVTHDYLIKNTGEGTLEISKVKTG